MRRSYRQTEDGHAIPEGCIFYAPLTNGDRTDHVSGTTGVIGNGQFQWSDTMGAYMIKTTTGGQKCLKFNIPGRFNLSPTYNYTYFADIYVQAFSGTCDFIALGSGTSDRYNAVSLAETHRWSGFSTGSWLKLALSKNGSTLTFYINGNVSKTSTTSTYAALNASSWSGWGDCTSVLSIGGGFNAYNYTAYIKNVLFFSRTLTQQEIQGL